MPTFTCRLEGRSPYLKVKCFHSFKSEYLQKSHSGIVHGVVFHPLEIQFQVLEVVALKHKRVLFFNFFSDPIFVILSYVSTDEDF